MTDEYIRKADAVKLICEWGTAQERIGRYAVTIHELKQNTADMLDELPSADVAPVVHGIWSYMGNHRSGLKVCECSNCKKRAFGSTAYCPNCGAKMDGGESDD